MSFGSRLKELRELRGMKQQELAAAIGVKNTAISNYELGISSPKEEIMFKIFEFFNVSPNYMFQDEINVKIEEYSIAEKEILRKYRALDTHGCALVENILNMEYNRCTAPTNTIELNLAASDGATATVKVDNADELRKDTEALKRRNRLL